MSLLLSTYDFEAAVIRAGESVWIDQRSDQPERRAAWPRRHPSPVLHVVADKHTFESGCTVPIPPGGLSLRVPVLAGKAAAREEGVVIEPHFGTEHELVQLRDTDQPSRQSREPTGLGIGGLGVRTSIICGCVMQSERNWS